MAQVIKTEDKEAKAEENVRKFSLVETIADKSDNMFLLPPDQNLVVIDRPDETVLLRIQDYGHAAEATFYVSLENEPTEAYTLQPGCIWQKVVSKRVWLENLGPATLQLTMTELN